MKTEDPAAESVEAVGFHQLIVHRIATRAQAEGTPLTPVELRQFDSGRLSGEEFRKLDEEFGGIDAWQPFLDRISGLLRRAIAEGSASDPTASARYDAMVHKLEDRPESFTLWACCVPAISGYQSIDQPGWRGIVIWLAVLAVIAFIFLHAVKIF